MPDPDSSCLGEQQWEHLSYFKWVMSVLPSLSLPPLPEALITVAGWICWTKRANGLIDMICQLICNLIILSSRTHYSLFITLLSSQVCCSCALRTTEYAFLPGKSHGGQEWRRGLLQRQSSWMLVVGTSASNLHTTGLGNAKGLAKEELGCFQ